MKVSPAKENMLKKIRQALSHSTPVPFPQSEGNNTVFQPAQQELEIEFAQRFTKLLGKFAYCTDISDLKDQLTSLNREKNWQKVYYSREDKKNNILPFLLQDSGMFPYYTEDLPNCDVAITLCECLIARTGSVVLSAAQHNGRTSSVYSPIHICIAFTGQLVYDIKDGLQLLKEKYQNKLPSLITFATGPSRTADIEKTLVVGVHGPKEVYVFLVDQQS